MSKEPSFSRWSRRAFGVLLASVCCIPLLGAAPASAAPAVTVSVSVAPLKFIVERIGGPRVRAGVIVPQAEQPDQYIPPMERLQAVGRTKLLITAGTGFEVRWAAKIQDMHPGLRVVRAAAGFPVPPVIEHPVTGELYLPRAYPWLSPDGAVALAVAIRDALTAVDPAGAKQYAARFERFKGETKRLDDKIRRILSRAGNRRFFLCGRPVWRVFADAYGLTPVPADISGDAGATAKRLAALRVFAKGKGISSIFVEPQYPSAAAGDVVDGGTLISANALAYTWDNNLIRLAGMFAAAVR